MSRALVEVRPAGSADLDDVLLLWTQARTERAARAAGGRAVPAADQIAPRLAEALDRRTVEVLVARRDGRPAGFVILREQPLSFMVDQPSLCIDQIYVTPSARRVGVARALLAHVAGRAERAGAEQIVSSVTPWARETHRFFARLGFSAVTVRRSVAPAMLRRRLAGESHRGALEDLLARRRSLRARAVPDPGRLLDDVS